jgi:putative zinc finger/helix-turn-helix YgiT family protein
MNFMTEVCVSCEIGTAHEVVESREIFIGGRHLLIADEHFMRCDQCQESYYTDAQAKISARKANDARRREEQLLTGEEIQRIRRSLFLSQRQLEDALGVSPKTIVRWENGTAVQSKALDDVLRLIALDPDNLRLLVRIRQATLTSLVEEKLSPQDDKQLGELKQAVYSGLEAAHTDALLMDRLTCSVVQAVMQHKRERIERYAKNTKAAIG